MGTLTPGFTNTAGDASVGTFTGPNSPSEHFDTISLGGQSVLMTTTLRFVPNSVTTINLSGYLALDCRATTDCLFGNTAAFSFGALPTGLSYTSSSGVFLTQAATTPEPGTIGLIGLGLAGLALFRKRQIGNQARR